MGPTEGEVATSAAHVGVECLLYCRGLRAGCAVRDKRKRVKLSNEIVSLVQGRDVVYWHQVSATLCNENFQLRKELSCKVELYKVLQENHVRLAAAFKESELKLNSLNREVAIIRSGLPLGRISIPAVPVGTQGRDAVFWHQCARTLQQQYLMAIAQLEAVATGNTNN
jgi:hypothetical protein